MTPDANGLCAFTVKRGDIENRIDPHFYLPVFMEKVEKIKKRSYARLGELVLFSKETTDFSEFPNGVFEYLEISGVALGINEYRTSTTAVNDAPSRAKMKTKAGDIVISTTRPHRGAIAEIIDNGIIASTGFSIIREIDNAIEKGWLLFTLLSRPILLQLLQRSSGGNYPAITEEEIKRICIPLLDLNVQKKMIAKLEDKRLSMNRKKEKAKSELYSFQKNIMDKYSLLNTQKRTFYRAIRNKDLDGVIDAKRYLATKKVGSQQLSDICDIIEEKTNVTKYGDEIVDWIRIDDLPNNPIDIETVRTTAASAMEGNFFEVKKDDVLVARLGPAILNQKIVLVRNIERPALASAEFLVLRCKSGYNPEAVMAILKTEYYRDLMYSHSRGSTPSRYRLNREDALKLPFPNIIKSQAHIAQEAMQVRDQVLKLRKEASDEWIAAKEDFEKELLGE